MKKKVQLLMCGLLVLCTGLLFTACGKQNFNKDKILITNTTYSYDGNAHIFTVTYDGVDTTVTYSLDNETFVSGEDLDVKEIGTYTIYFKLSAENYNDYIGNAQMTINQREFDTNTISESNLEFKYDGNYHMFDVNVQQEGVTITYSNDGINFSTLNSVKKKEVGVYTIYYKVSHPNFQEYIGNAQLIISKANFNQNSISVVRKTQTYSGNKMMFEINYPDNISIKYSLDGENFKTFDEMNIVNAGTYEIYYKLSNPNYNDYTGKATFVIQKADLQESQISVTNTSYNYDGNKHMFDVNVNDIATNITYSTDNVNFVNKEELNIVSAGEHKVYYKITSDNYNDYIDNATLTINKLTLNENMINIGATSLTYTGTKQSVPVSVEGIDATVTYSLDNYTFNNSPYLVSIGEYTLYYKIETENYETFTGNVKVYINGVKLVRNNIARADYATIALALENAEEDDVITLYGDSVLNETLSITKTIGLDGQSKYAIKASDTFAGGNLISVATTASTKLTLTNITVDANSKARVIYVNNSNKLQIVGATITGGYLEDSYAPGVFITNKASFTMVGGSITGNKVSDNYAKKDEYYVAYSLDLWIGANASGTGVQYQISEGHVGKMFINANDYSAKNPGKFTLIGGTVDSIYLEYDANYGAKLEYQNGTINKLLISTKTSGVYKEVNPVIGTTYNGGIDE